MAGGTARAQAPADGATSGTVSNASAAGENVVTAAPEDSGVIGVDATEPTGAEPLPNTGGAPLVMLLGGIALAGGSLLLRRKLA